jgi:hypothetical protein
MASPYRRYLAAVLATFVVAWLAFSIISYTYKIAYCNLAPYSPPENYVALCSDTHFGDFEHEAFYYGLFETDRKLREADVLFIGDSHLQFAFSRPNVEPFFKMRHARFFLAGFGYQEGWHFIDEVFKRHPPKPKILVINEDGFSAQHASEPAEQVTEHPISSFIESELKSVAQPIEATLCRACGRADIIVRSRETGQWYWPNFNNVNIAGAFPVTPSASPSEGNLEAWLAQAEPQARKLITDASATCIVLTDAPYNGPVGAFARALAGRLGARLILPELAGLRTQDGSHLDAQSAVNWSNAFLAELDAVGSRCGAW